MEAENKERAFTPLGRSAGRKAKRVQWSDQVPLPGEKAAGRRLEFDDLEEVPRLPLKEKKWARCHSDKDLQLQLSQHKIADLEH